MFRLAQDSVNKQVNVEHINLHHYNSISTLSVVRWVLRWLFNFAEFQVIRLAEHVITGAGFQQQRQA